MDDLEGLIHEERAQRHAQELQVAQLLRELQNQRQFSQNA